MAITVAAGALIGAGAWDTAASAAPLRQPGSLPYPKLAAGTDTIPQIEHVVVLMMENHSYDNYLGMLRRPGADGFRFGRDGLPSATNPYGNGQVQHAFRMPTHCQLDARPSQEWTASHNAYDNGRMDGFVSTPIDPLTTETVGGVAYCNNYVLLTRFRDGKIVEHVEYFDPMLVIEMMKSLGG